MYDENTLSVINRRFLSSHLNITDYDVDMANKNVGAIERSRSKLSPMPGDIVRYTNKYSKYFHHAHVESVCNGEAYICEEPYIPFVSCGDTGVRCVTSGGSWVCIKTEKMHLIGRDKKLFNDWGHNGPCADGAICFEAYVNVWEFISDEVKFGTYTTKDWDMRYINERKSPDEYGYLYVGDGIAFKTEKEYLAWLLTFNGVEFKGPLDGQIVVFTYKRAPHLVDEAGWHGLELPTDTRRINGGTQTIKYFVDHDSHIVHEYRFSNVGDLDWRFYRPYSVAISQIEKCGIKRDIKEVLYD